MMHQIAKLAAAVKKIWERYTQFLVPPQDHLTQRILPFASSDVDFKIFMQFLHAFLCFFS